MNIGCIVMAAGMSSRFGGNKLAQEWQGKSLIRHALEAVPTDRLSAVVVVTQYPEVVALAKEFSFTPIVNSHPEYGQSHTIHLGVKALDACDALLFQVADQPLLRRESVAELIDFYRRNPGHIVGLGHGGQRGNPCIFPARFFPELLTIEGAATWSSVSMRTTCCCTRSPPMSCGTWIRRKRWPSFKNVSFVSRDGIAVTALLLTSWARRGCSSGAGQTPAHRSAGSKRRQWPVQWG